MSRQNRTSCILRKVLAMLLFVIMVVSVAGCGQKGTSGSGEIKIGVATPVTGPAPLQGERSKQGLQIAVDEINAKGGLLGKKVVLEVVDDQGTVPGALLAVAKLVSDPTIVAVMGPFSSSSVLGVSDLYKNAKVPFFT